ncbi:ThiF family adenylyltransferase [Candidatus Acetothermia bacterium]|nr:ThiF family adenylyltransferase [Candidatus Acetothermia bacterium]
MRTKFSGSSSRNRNRWTTFETGRFSREKSDGPFVTDRQERVPGFCQNALANCRLGFVGAGGINGPIARNEVRKGVGESYIMDHDIVELSNLNRQLFYEKDIGKSKAICLAKNLIHEGTTGTKVHAIGKHFQDVEQSGLLLCPDGRPIIDILICGVDNSMARIATAYFGLKHNIPVIISAVSGTASHGYVFVQKPGKACFVCLFPFEMEDYAEPCPVTPAVLDILSVMSGLATFAVDSLIMQRPRGWDVRMIYLDGNQMDWNGRVPKRDGCPLCGSLMR